MLLLENHGNIQIQDLVLNTSFKITWLTPQLPPDMSFMSAIFLLRPVL